jgi:hypothetical protein
MPSESKSKPRTITRPILPKEPYHESLLPADLHWRESAGPLLDYYFAAEVESEGRKKNVTTPPEAPQRFHTVMLA